MSSVAPRWGAKLPPEAPLFGGEGPSSAAVARWVTFGPTCTLVEVLLAQHDEDLAR